MGALAALATAVFGTAWRATPERPKHLAVVAGTDVPTVRDAVPVATKPSPVNVMLRQSLRIPKAADAIGGDAVPWDVVRDEPCAGTEFVAWYVRQRLTGGAVPTAKLWCLYLECCEVYGLRPLGRRAWAQQLKKCGVTCHRPRIWIDGKECRPHVYRMPEVA